MKSENRLPITVLSGFLGSGKTTLLRRWRTHKDLRDAAVIVHDLSEFGIDVELLSDDTSEPVEGRLVDRVAALHGIHAGEQLHASLGRVLGEIAELDPAPPHVLCESTGAARPWPLITAVCQDERFFLRHFIVTVDALNLHRDFADGRVFTGEVAPPDDPAIHHAAQILAEQLLFANVVILTKIDTVAQAVVDSQVQTLRQLQPHATVGLCAQGGLLLPQLDATPAPEFAELERCASHFGLTRDAPIAGNVDSIILRDPRPFHPQRLYDVCQTELGTGLYRTKGFLWMASRPADVLLWQQSSSQIALEITGLWSAEAVKNSHGKLIPSEVMLLQKHLDTTHSIFGDRNNELTLIGLPAACKHFEAALRTALCTEDEVAAWKRGEVFTDPWPQSLRTIS